MADREMALRFLAFRMRPYSQYSENDLNQFLLDAMKSINGLPDEDLAEHERAFEKAMRAARTIFGNDAFRKRFSPKQGRSPVNKALFEVVSVGLAALSDDELEHLATKAESVRNELMSLMNLSSEFVTSISVATGTPRRVKLRFDEMKKVFDRVLGHTS
jgi:hypothetical protein